MAVSEPHERMGGSRAHGIQVALNNTDILVQGRLHPSNYANCDVVGSNALLPHRCDRWNCANEAGLGRITVFLANVSGQEALYDKVTTGNPAEVMIFLGADNTKQNEACRQSRSTPTDGKRSAVCVGRKSRW